MTWPRIADASAGLVIVCLLIVVGSGLATHLDTMWAAEGGERALPQINVAHKIADTGLWLLVSLFAGVLVATGGRRSLGIFLIGSAVAITLVVGVTVSAMVDETVGSMRTSFQFAHMRIREYQNIFDPIPVDRRPFWLAVFVHAKVVVHVSAMIAVFLTTPPHRARLLKWSALLLMTLSLFLSAFSTLNQTPLIAAFMGHAVVAWACVVSLGFLVVVWLSQSGRVLGRGMGLAIFFGAGAPLIVFGGSWLGNTRSSGIHTNVANLSGEEMGDIFVFGAVAAAIIAVGAVAAIWRRLSPPSLVVDPNHF